MKKVLVLLFCFLLIFCFTIVVFAHPGGTDGGGGHTDRDTGEYHYHHGHPAHDHYDMDGDGVIDCPYDFDDKTGKSSGSGSNNTSGDSSDNRTESGNIYRDESVNSATATTIPANTQDEARKTFDWKNLLQDTIPLVLVSCAMLLLSVSGLISIFNKDLAITLMCFCFMALFFIPIYMVVTMLLIFLVDLFK